MDTDPWPEKEELDSSSSSSSAQERNELDISMKAEEIHDFCRDKLGHSNGNISSQVYSQTSGNPKTIKINALSTSELRPPTPSVYVRSKEDAYSPQLFELCLQKPIVLVRNLAPVCDIDLSLYSTKTLVQAHPSHPVEIRTQMEQTADENWDPTMKEQVWYCSSSRSHTTIAKYAEYQASSLQEARSNMKEGKTVNPSFDFRGQPNRRMIKFGTNCDLSDNKKWGPQLKELFKLPAWARVVSAGNMLNHVGHQILGMNTVQLYMKVPCARTPGHQENNNFCAVNINIGPGDSEWFGVPNEHWAAMEGICQENKLNYLHGSWWPDVKDLTAAGIPYYRFLQKPGDLVWVNVGCVHWVQATGWCNNIAWNVGPLTFHQYKVALERYEWNKLQKYQSIVAMVFLSWNLARNIKVGELRLHNAIKHTLLQSLRITVQTLCFVKSKGVEIRFHGRNRNDLVHYCGMCDEEVFNTLFVKGNEKKNYVVHCLNCALKQDKDLKGMVCLEEHRLEELFEVYDNFVFIPGTSTVTNCSQWPSAASTFLSSSSSSGSILGSTNIGAATAMLTSAGTVKVEPR